MKKIVVRSFALFLALSLTLVSPSFALRDQTIAEKDPQALTGLEEALRTPPLPTPATAGLEENRWGEELTLEEAKERLQAARGIESMEVHLGERGSEQIVKLSNVRPADMDGILEKFAQGKKAVFLLLRPEGPTQIRILPASAAAGASARLSTGLGEELPKLDGALPEWISKGLKRINDMAEAGRAIKQLRLQSAERKPLAHVLYNEATLAILFFLHVPPTADLSPNIAVVDPLLRMNLQLIPHGAGFSQEFIDTWDKDYLVPYDPEIKGDIERAMREAESRIAQRMPGVVPLSIFSLPDALGEFGTRLKEILASFGLTFQSGTLTDDVIGALYRVAEA